MTDGAATCVAAPAPAPGPTPGAAAGQCTGMATCAASCGTIENCPAAACTSAGVSDCPQCAAGFYAVRRDEEATRCLPVSMTLKAASSAVGRFTVTMTGADVPRDLTGGAFMVPSTVALELRGSAGAAAPQLGTTFIVSGTLGLVGVSGTINGLGVTPGGSFALDASSSATVGAAAIPACSAVSAHDGTLANDCLAALMIEVWDSGGTLNSNGVTFTLFKLAAQPASTFAFDAAVRGPVWRGGPAHRGDGQLRQGLRGVQLHAGGVVGRLRFLQPSQRQHGLGGPRGAFVLEYGQAAGVHRGGGHLLHFE